MSWNSVTARLCRLSSSLRSGWIFLQKMRASQNLSQILGVSSSWLFLRGRLLRVSISFSRLRRSRARRNDISLAKSRTPLIKQRPLDIAKHRPWGPNDKITASSIYHGSTSGFSNYNLEIEYYVVLHDDNLRASPVPTDHAIMANRHKNFPPHMTNSRNAVAALVDKTILLSRCLLHAARSSRQTGIQW